MFKPRHATTPSSRSFPTEVGPLELSFSELAMILGGQSQPNRGQELLDQFGRTGETVINEYVAPILRVADEGYKLGVAVENYARWAVEHQQSRELSEERGRQLDAEQREAEEQKHREQQENNDRLLQGDRPTSPQEVADWLDIVATEPSYSGQTPDIPSNLTDPAPPPHTPRIILEPVDYTPYQHPG